MARVLAISSQVARGHVGLSACVPALQRLGHETVALPTVLLSNHPGHGKFTGEQVAPDLLRRMLDALEDNGWLGDVDAILTGYLPSEAHVRLACETVRRVRAARGDVRVLVDPILGDEPKGLYIDRGAAEAIREELVELADVLTPNRFELRWLAGQEDAAAADVVRLASGLGVDCVAVTSAVEDGGRLGNVLVRTRESALAAWVARRDRVPNGTGDLFAGLYLGHALRIGRDGAVEAFARALAGVDATITASSGRDELALVAAQDRWLAVEPLTLERFSG